MEEVLAAAVGGLAAIPVGVAVVAVPIGVVLEVAAVGLTAEALAEAGNQPFYPQVPNAIF